MTTKCQRKRVIYVKQTFKHSMHRKGKLFYYAYFKGDFSHKNMNCNK